MADFIRVARSVLNVRYASGILIYSNSTGRFLLIQRSQSVPDPLTWGPVSGYIEKGEDPLTAVRREAFEEIGLSRIEIDPIPLYTFENESLKFFNFMGNVDREFDPVLDSESVDFVWTTMDSLPAPLHPNFQIFVDSFINPLLSLKRG